MAKKAKRKKVDVSKLSPSELKAYKKRLADVRKYVRAKREWQKRIAAGELSPKITLQMYRRALAEGKPIPSSEELKEDPTGKIKEADVLEKIKRLIEEIDRGDKSRQKLQAILENLSA